MNYNETPLSKYDEEILAGAQSYSSMPRPSRTVLPKLEDIETRLQKKQSCVPSNSSRPRTNSKLSGFSWRRLLTFLTTWMKSANPAGPPGLEAAAESNPKPNHPNQNTNHVQMRHTCTPKHSGHQQVKQEYSDRKCSKKSSYERIICINNFDDPSNIDQRSYCDPCMNTGLASAVHSKLIQVGIAEVPSHRTGARSRCCICKRLVQKTPDAAKSFCRQSLLVQAWEYLQSMIFSHRSDCPRCNKKPSPCSPCSSISCRSSRACDSPSPCSSPKPCGNPNSCGKPKPCGSPKPPCPNLKPSCPNLKPSCPNLKPSCPNLKPRCPNLKPKCPNYKPSCPKLKPKQCPNSPSCLKRQCSNDSSICKDSVLELVKDYLKKITSEHKSSCPRCRQQPQCCQTEEPSCLRYMLEQAWAYIKKSCEQNTRQQQRALSCGPQPPIRVPACSNPGILKYPSAKPTCCCGNPKPDSPDKKPCQKVYCPKPEKPITCPQICEQPPVPCKSEVEGTHEHKSCYTPCCVHNSQGIQPSYTSYTGSHDKSCCLSRAKTKDQSKWSHNDLQSYEDPLAEENFSKNSSGCQLGREIIGFRSSTECKTPCSKDSKDGKQPGSPCKGGMQGLSLTMKPMDHKFCTNPNECKHSKESLENMKSKGPSGTDCKKTSSKPCKVPKCPTSEQQVQTPLLECSGGCVDCPLQHKAAPTCNEEREVDADYEAMFDKQFAEMLAKQLEKQASQDVCEDGCNCMTCIASVHTIRKDKPYNRKDPHNYRFYY